MSIARWTALPRVLSSISGTLVGTDLVLTAGQAFVLTADQSKSASVIFNYQTTCAGARPGNYAGRFRKVKRIVKLGFFGAVDYALLATHRARGRARNYAGRDAARSSRGR